MVEEFDFHSPMLIKLKAQLTSNQRPASEIIKKLSALTHRLSSRANMLYGILDLPLLLDAFLLVGLHQWKKRHGPHIGEWLDTIHEIECLISLAGFQHANPEFSTRSTLGDSTQPGSLPQPNKQ